MRISGFKIIPPEKIVISQFYETEFTPINPYLLDEVSDIELSFAPWQTKQTQTDILKVRRSSDDSEDIIQPDSNGIISDSSLMKTSGQDLRTWTNDYSDTLYVVEYYHVDGASNEQPVQSTQADQPEFDPINWQMLHDGINHLKVAHNTIAPDKWEPFFQSDFGITFYCKRDDVNASGVTEIGYLQRASEDVLTIIRAGLNDSVRLQGIYWAGDRNTNAFNTDSNYDPYNQKNTNYFTVTFLARFSTNEGQLIYNGNIIETIDISGIDPSGWDVSVSQLRWNIGYTLLGKIISHAMYPNPTASRISTVEQKLKEPVNAYTAFFVENNSGYILAASVLDKQSFYQNRSCRIRRSSDNAEVNVLWDSNDSISDSSLLEGSGDDLGTWAGNDTLYVRRVHDASGYEDHLGQLDTSKQPTLDLPNNNVVFSSGDELVTEKTGNSFTSDFKTKQLTEFGEQPISSIKTTAEFYNEIRLEEGYSDTENVNPLTNFADSGKPNATPETPSKQGEFVANDLNGYPSILLDGTDDYYDLGDTYETFFQSDWGFVTVVNDPVIDATRFLFGVLDSGENNGAEFWYQAGGKLRTRYWAGGSNDILVTDAQEIFSNQPLILGCMWEFSTNTIIIRTNGSNKKTGSTTLDPTLYTSTINPYLYARNSGGSDLFRYSGKSAVPGVLVSSLSDFENAFTKLNEKYAIY